MTDEEKADDKFKQLMDAVNQKYEDVEQILLDYLLHGAKFDTTLTLLQETGLSYTEASNLLADVMLAELTKGDLNG